MKHIVVFQAHLYGCKGMQIFLSEANAERKRRESDEVTE